MKDMYSFHAAENDLNNFYVLATEAYKKIYARCGLQAIVTEASGGIFSQEFSHEFQTPTPYGEDEIIYCSAGDFAQNTEICKLSEGDKCPNCTSQLLKAKTIEVGNIFKLGCKYSHDLGLTYADPAGDIKEVFMGCYGIGPSRVMGAVVEVFHDDKGIIWPKEITPYQAHLLLLTEDSAERNRAKKLHQDLVDQGWDVLFDDREVSPGVKLNDADLMGASLQFIIGDRTKDQVEYKSRDKKAEGKLKEVKVPEFLEEYYSKKK